MPNNLPYTIQVFYPATNDTGKTFRATTAFHTVATDQRQAYANADEAFKTRPEVSFGFILPGHHNILPGLHHHAQ